MIPYPVIVGFVVIGIILIPRIIKSQQGGKNVGTNKPATPPPPPQPAAPPPRKRLGWLTWLVVLALLVGAVVLGLYGWRYYHNSKQRLELEAGQLPSRPSLVGRQGSYTWWLPSGQYNRGRNSDTVRVTITKDNDEEMVFVSAYTYDGQLRSGQYELKKKDDKAKGRWRQNVPPDGGEVVLEQTGLLTWSGHETDREGNRPRIELTIE
jgi:hypothetical protein